MDVSEFNGRRLYTGLRLDYRLRLSAATPASRAISAVAELFVLSMYCLASACTAVQSILSDMKTYMPSDSDMDGALLALVRIQTTYGLSVDDLASGRIAGHTAVLPLSEQTVFDVAVLCLGDGRPDVALQWLDHINNASIKHSAIPLSALYQAYARAFAQVVTRDVMVT